MTDKDKRMELPKISLDDLFTTQEQRDAEDYVIPIPLEQIDDFPNHPYKVRDDDKMKELSESIKTYGVSQPVIVRKKDNGRYLSIDMGINNLIAAYDNKGYSFIIKVIFHFDTFWC